MNRFWQVDSRWLRAYEARWLQRSGIRQDMSPDKVDDRLYDLWAEMLGFQDSTPVSYTEDGIAIVSIVGPLCKGKGSPWCSNYASIMEGLSELIELPPAAVVLKIDSPGGMVDGLTPVVEAVNQLAEKTLVVASIVGGGLSAAYRIASQAGSIWASSDSEIGSIGTYWQMLDVSKAYADAGIRSVLLTTGPFKGVGAAGEAITADQEAFLQSKVNEWNARFLADVASGRSMSEESVAAVADGRWWSAADAVGLGLVDQIGSMDDVLAAIRAQKGESMGKQTLQPATAAEAPAAAVELPPVVATVETVTGPDLGAYMTAFGDLEGARMFRDGLSFSDAQARHLETLQGTIQDLRAELETAGDRFRGHSDTEVFLAAFERFGIKATLQRAVGMFAFAVWDKQAKQIVLGRDRIGEKPLYYGHVGKAFVFASELKPLRQFPGWAGEIDPTAFYFVHSFAAPVGPHTLAVSNYGGEFSAVVRRDNFRGAQFHPERSARPGARLLSNFLKIT